MITKELTEWQAKIENEIAELKKRIEKLEGNLPKQGQQLTWQ